MRTYTFVFTQHYDSAQYTMTFFLTGEPSQYQELLDRSETIRTPMESVEAIGQSGLKVALSLMDLDFYYTYLFIARLFVDHDGLIESYGLDLINAIYQGKERYIFSRFFLHPSEDAFMSCLAEVKSAIGAIGADNMDECKTYLEGMNELLHHFDRIFQTPDDYDINNVSARFFVNSNRHILQVWGFPDVEVDADDSPNSVSDRLHSLINPLCEAYMQAFHNIQISQKIPAVLTSLVHIREMFRLVTPESAHWMLPDSLYERMEMFYPEANVTFERFYQHDTSKKDVDTG